MGTSNATSQPVRLLVDVTRTPDGRLEGRISLGSSDPEHTFSGVLELLKVLEDLLDRDGATRTSEGPAR
jgi:hypothetical protein